jgi:hypothetical protein
MEAMEGSDDDDERLGFQEKEDNYNTYARYYASCARRLRKRSNVVHFCEEDSLSSADDPNRNYEYLPLCFLDKIFIVHSVI